MRRFLSSVVLICWACLATAAMGQNLTPLNVQMLEIDPTKLPAFIAADEGIFRKNGLDVHLYTSTAARDTALRRDVHVPEQFVRDDRTAPIIMAGSFGFVRISSEAEYDSDRVMIATLDPMIHWKIVGSKDIAGLEGLKGKRLAVNPRTETELISRVLIQQTHWDPLFDISLLNAPADLIPLRKGSVDALIASEVLQAAALNNGYHVIFDTSVWKIPIPAAGINTTRSWLKENRDTAVRFVRSIVEGIALMKKDRHLAYRTLAKWYNITDPSFQKIIYDGTSDMERKPYPSVEGIKTFMKLYDSLQMRKHKPEEFYDDTVLGEVDRNGFIESLYK